MVRWKRKSSGRSSPLLEAAMTFHNAGARGLWGIGVLAVGLLAGPVAPAPAAEDQATVAGKAHAILEQYCHRCHGRDGSLEGGMNYILDRDKLVARKKVLPG